MKNFKAISLFWSISMILTFCLITIFALSWKNKQLEYKKLEEEIKQITEEYLNEKEFYPKGIEVINITTKDLEEYKNDIILSVGKDKCQGNITVFNDDELKINVELNCKHYKSIHNSIK